MAARRMSLTEVTERGTNSKLSAVAAPMDGSARIDIKESGEAVESLYQRFISQKPKIQTVQPFLRKVKNNKRSYDPRLVSIGPCHHGKPELEAVERFKVPMAQEFAENWVVNTDELYEEVVKVASDARNCYAESLTQKFNDQKFARMMFLDGCFTLHYICSIVEANTRMQ